MPTCQHASAPPCLCACVLFPLRLAHRSSSSYRQFPIGQRAVGLSTASNTLPACSEALPAGSEGLQGGSKTLQISFQLIPAGFKPLPAGFKSLPAPASSDALPAGSEILLCKGPIESLPNSYQTDIIFNFNETSEAEVTAVNVTLLRMFFLPFLLPSAITTSRKL